MQIVASNHTKLTDESIKEKLFYFFLLCMVMDVGGTLGLKYVSFCIVGFYLLLRMADGSIKIPVGFILTEGLIFFYFPVILLAYSVWVYSISPLTVIGQISPFATWLIYLLMINLSSKEIIINNLKKVGIFCSFLVIILFLLIEALYLVGKTDIIWTINGLGLTYRLGYLGQKFSEGNYFGFLPNVYFRWSMLLIPICILFSNGTKKQWIYLFISFLAIILTLSTGIILFALIGLVFFAMLSKKNAKPLVIGKYVIICLLLLLVIYMFGIDQVNILTSKLSTESNSTAVKIGHIKSAIDEIMKNPMTFLFGTGIGSSFYSKGINDFTINIEVSHINMVRQFGTIYFLIFSTYVFSVIIKAISTDEDGKKLGVGLLCFYLASGTNPLLISPIFFIMLIITKAYIVLFRKERRNE